VTSEYYVLPDDYEQGGRCRIWGVNWHGDSTQAIDLTACGMTSGQTFKVYDQFNPTTPVETGVVYNSGSPMHTFSLTGLPYTAMQGCTSGCPGGNDAKYAADWSLTPSKQREVAFLIVVEVLVPTPTPTITLTPTSTATPLPFIYKLLEAESGTITTPMESVADGTASGGFYVDTTVSGSNVVPVAPANSDVISFTITKDAYYRLWARIKAPTSTQDSFYVVYDSESGLRDFRLHVELGVHLAVGDWERPFFKL
jgi:hypothetical protein